jgi:hypothetical protein
MTPLSSPSAPKRIASLVTAINVLVAGGFSIAGLVSPKSMLPAGYAPTEASFIFAMYAAARSIPPRPYGSNRDLQAVAISVAGIGHIGRFDTIAGCGRRVAAA